MANLIGIDLGTSNTRIVTKEGKHLLFAPSVLSIDRVTHEVIASGNAAKRMIGKTPSNILALRPIREGVITDLDVTTLMLRDFFTRLDILSMFNRPSVMVTTPFGLTEVEKNAVKAATFSAGAKAVNLVESPLAAAVGAGIPIMKAHGVMIVNLGGGVSEASVISLGGVVKSNSLRVAGNELDLAIVSYLKQHRNILIGEITAELLKIRLGSAVKDGNTGSMTVCGRDLSNGLAATATVTSDEIYKAIRAPIAEIVHMIKLTLEETPPELSSDIFDTGILLVGGGAHIAGIDRAIYEYTGIRVFSVKHPMKCVSVGLGKLLQTMGDSPVGN